MTTILGLDIGVASVGFALIARRADGRQTRILRMGVRVFPEGRTEDKQEPRNLERRTARLRRRQLRRRRQRRRQLGDTLIAAGMLPPFDLAPDSAWRAVMARDPYVLRKTGLGQPLAPIEIGRALYHLAQHRGFWSAQVERPKTKEEEKEAGVVKEAIAALNTAMGDRTLGAYLADLPAGDAKRGRHLSRTMIEIEFDRLWRAQAAHHPALMTEDLRRRVAAPMFFQRPTYWKRATLWRYEMERGRNLAVRSSYLGQRFVMLQEVNSLRRAGGNARPLTAVERATLLGTLKGQKSKTVSVIRKLFKPLWQVDGIDLKAKFNFEEEKRKTLPGNAVRPYCDGGEISYVPARHSVWVAEILNRGGPLTITVAAIKHSGNARLPDIYLDTEIRNNEDA